MGDPGPLGSLTIEDGRATLTFVRHLPHRATEVWAAITEPARRAAWFGQSTVQASAGGIIETDPDDPPVPASMKHMRGTILVWDPPHILEHTWQQAIVEPSVVRYELTPADGVTILRFTHRDLGVQNARGFAPGTHAYLDRLAAHLGAQELPRWQARYDEVRELYR